ncbi:MAG: PQQ-binding-like beta-propeller repeat protein, partial [Planctomycetota bacterium]
RRSAAMIALLLLAFAHNPAEADGEEPVIQIGTPREVIAGDYRKRTLARLDEEGNVVWSRRIRAIHDLHILPNGHVLYQTNFRNVIEENANGETVWRYDAPEGVEIHAFQRLPDGSTLVAESGVRRLIEVRKDGSIQKEIPLTVETPDKHRDTRLARKTAAGTYLVAHEKDAAVREYDADGTVVWSYDVGSKVYGVERLANGNTLIGAGDGHSVIEVNPAGETVWTLTSDDLPDIELAWVTTATRRPNGNTLVVNCHAGPENPQILEVTPEKRVVWSYKNFETFGNALPVAVLPKR